jgi:hypothetical protein
LEEKKKKNEFVERRESNQIKEKDVPLEQEMDRNDDDDR